MRWNEQEVVQQAQKTPEWEGLLSYLQPSKSRSPFSSGSSEPRERWFKLRGNLLFYFRTSSMNSRPPLGAEPMGLLVLERFHVQREGFEARHAFSIIFSSEPNKKHFFVAESERSAKQWEAALRRASYQKLREHLINLQIKLISRTGVDPLKGTIFSNSSDFKDHPSTAVSPDDVSDTALNPPKAKPRKNRATFQSHVVTNWENYSPVVQQTSGYLQSHNPLPTEDNPRKKASFKSHIDVPTGNLLDL